MTSISSKAALAASAFAVLAAGPAQAATRSVDVGPGAKALPQNRTYDANAFLPGTVTVHVGDKVKFNLNGFHTVTFDDQAKTPLFITDPGKPSGEKDGQGNPFWFSDKDRLVANPAAVFPRPGVNSGVSLGDGPPAPFVKTFRKTGTFTYFCAVHPGMTGKVKVVAKSKAIPSQKAVARQAKKELAGYAAKAKAADKAGQSAPDTIQAGADGKGFVNYAFYPAKLTVPVNTPGHPTTGVLPSGPGSFPTRQTITFTKPGTYAYICLIHPEMHGTVEVS